MAVLESNKEMETLSNKTLESYAIQRFLAARQKLTLIQNAKITNQHIEFTSYRVWMWKNIRLLISYHELPSKSKFRRMTTPASEMLTFLEDEIKYFCKRPKKDSSKKMLAICEIVRQYANEQIG